MESIEQILQNTTGENESKTDWTKAWSAKYPVLADYRNKVDVSSWARPSGCFRTFLCPSPSYILFIRISYPLFLSAGQIKRSYTAFFKQIQLPHPDRIICAARIPVQRQVYIYFIPDIQHYQHKILHITRFTARFLRETDQFIAAILTKHAVIV